MLRDSVRASEGSESSQLGINSREELVRRAGQLVPVLQERAEQTESLRRIPEETVGDMISAGLLRIATPERFGGHGLEFDVLLDVTFELGRGCGSSAWCYAIWSSDSWYVGMFPERAQQEFWSDSADTLCASSFNPTQGNVKEVQGGYSLSGHWDFASGCDAASWILVTAVAKAGPVMFLVPRSDFTIEDIWHVSGLRGTGSNDIIIQDAFVPGYRALLVEDIREARTPGRELHSTMGYRAPNLSLEVYIIDAPIVGMAKGALEAFESSMSRKISEMRGGIVSESAISRSMASVRAPACTARIPMTPTPRRWAAAMISRGRGSSSKRCKAPGESRRFATAQFVSFALQVLERPVNSLYFPGNMCHPHGPCSFNCRAIAVSSLVGSKKSTKVGPTRYRIDLCPLSAISSVLSGLSPKLLSKYSPSVGCSQLYK